jgi:hypothetical protein
MFTIKSNQACDATLTVTDVKGDAAKLDGVPVWTSSDTSILTVSVSADGLSGTFQAVGPAGVATITVVGDADLSAGISALTGVLEVTVVLADTLATSITVIPGLPYVIGSGSNGSGSNGSGQFPGSIRGTIGTGVDQFTLNADGVTYTRNSDGITYVQNSDGSFSNQAGYNSGSYGSGSYGSGSWNSGSYGSGSYGSGSFQNPVIGTVGSGPDQFTLNADGVTYTRNSDGVNDYSQNSDGSFSRNSGYASGTFNLGLGFNQFGRQP